MSVLAEEVCWGLVLAANFGMNKQEAIEFIWSDFMKWADEQEWPDGNKARSLQS